MIAPRIRLSSRVGRAACGLVLGLSILVTASARAAVDPERIEDAETGWYYLSNVTEAQIWDVVDTYGARVTDIEIYSTSPLRFTAAFVANAGVYASGWWWYFGLTFEQVAEYVDQNNARLIDIERYEVDGQARWAVVMVPNSGAQQKAWWYYAGITPSLISSYLDENGARLVDIESYVSPDGGRLYAVIMIANVGEDYTPWGWFYNADLATIQAYLSENNFRILEFEVRDAQNARFDAIMIPLAYHTPATWWWYYNVPFSQLDDLANQAGSRIVDIDTYVTSGQRRYNVVMLNNATPLTVEIGQIMDWGADGDTGCYLREIGGPTLAALQPDFPFEPASTIKAVYHLHTMRDVMAGGADLDELVTYSENYSGSCPLGGAPFTTQPLQEVLRRMMVNSDNAAAKAISDRYGFAAITSTAQNVAGMASTSANHTLGCGAEAIANPNTLTLADAGRMYERIQNLQIVDEPARDTYYSLMQNQDTPSPWWFTTDLRATIDEEAADLGLPENTDSFWANVEIAWKPGGYTLIFDGSNHEYLSVAGIVSLPYCDGWPTLRYRRYVFGTFVHDGGDNSYAFDRIRDGAKELFRGVVRQALLSCPTAVDEPTPLAGTALLEPGVPNPFNPSTQLFFNLDRTRHVTLAVYDAAGREVAVLVDANRPAGRHVVRWDGRDAQGRPAPAGVYVARLRAGDRTESRKLALIK